MKRSTWILTGSSALALALLGAALLAPKSSPRTTSAALSPSPVEPPPPQAASPSSPPPSPLPSQPEDLGTAAKPLADPLLLLGERELMNELRPLLSVDDERVVRVTRIANERWPNSVDAPERAWMLVKSLSRLERHHEAKDEGKRMVEAYPDANFTSDVRRHVLVYPLDQPSREEMQQGAVPRVPPEAHAK